MPKTDQTVDTIIDVLERHYVGVMDRNVAVSATEVRRVSESGTYGDREVMAKPERNAAINAEFKMIGRSHGTQLALLSEAETDVLVAKLDALRELIYDSLEVDVSKRARLTRRAENLIDRSSVTAQNYRDVEGGLDEIIASAPAANYLTGAIGGIATQPGREYAKDALSAIATVLSAVRIPTEAGQARDDLGFGAFHPTRRALSRLRPKGGASAHDRFNRERASVGKDILRSLRASSCDEIYDSIEILVRAASAATANSLALSASAKNYFVHPDEDAARIALQSRYHDALKSIFWLGEADRESQARTAPNRRSKRRRAVSPDRRGISLDQRLAPSRARSAGEFSEVREGRSARRRSDRLRVSTADTAARTSLSGRVRKRTNTASSDDQLAKRADRRASDDLSFTLMGAQSRQERERRRLDRERRQREERRQRQSRRREHEQDDGDASEASEVDAEESSEVAADLLLV